MSHDLYLKKETSPSDGFVYKFNLSKEHAIKLSEKLGCLKDTSPSIPEDLPAFSKIDGHEEVIMIETGFGVSFAEEHLKDVDQALQELGYDVFTEDREWV